MNKLLTKIAVSLLGMSLAVGVGVAVGSKDKASSAEAATTAGTNVTTTLGSGSGQWNAGSDWSYTSSSAATATATSGADAAGQTWTISYQFASGKYSRTPANGSIQFGAKGSSPYKTPTALSLTSSALTKSMKLTAFSCVYGGSGSGAASKATLYYDSTSLKVGSGVSGSNTETVSWTGNETLASGTVLKVVFSNMTYGTKIQNVKYTLANATTTYTVSGTITNGALSSTDPVDSGSALNITLNPNIHYHLPDSLTSVTMGGNTLVAGTGYIYNNSTGAIGIASVTGNVVITATCPADPKYTVTYSASTNGSGTYAVANQWSGDYTLLDYASISGDGKVNADTGYRFKDYTVGGVKKEPGDTISLNSATTVTVNFEERPNQAKYTITAVNTAGLDTSFDNVVPTGAGFSFAATYTNNAYQMTSGHTQTWTFTGYSGKIIKSMKASVKNNATSGVGAAAMTNNGSSVTLKEASFSGLGGTYAEHELIKTNLEVAGNVVLTLSCSTNSFFCEYVLLEWEDADVLDEDLTIDSPTESFTVGDEFEFGGTATASYSISGDVDVTDDVTFELNGSSISEGDTITSSMVGDDVEVAVWYEDAKGNMAGGSYTVDIAYAAVTSVSITTSASEMAKSSEFTFGATVLPSTANPNVTWSASSADLVEDDDFSINATTGKLEVDASTGGTIRVTATTVGKDSSSASKTAYVDVTVTGDPVVTVASALAGYSGKDTNLAYSFNNFTGTLSVVSSDTSKVTVGTPTVTTGTSGSGTVQVNFKAAGSSTLTFKNGSDNVATCVVTVTASAVSSVGWLDSGNMTVYSGSTALNASKIASWGPYYEMNNGDSDDIESDYTVQLNGNAYTLGTALEAGTYTVTLTYGGQTTASSNPVVTVIQSLNTVTASSTYTWEADGSFSFDGNTSSNMNGITWTHGDPSYENKAAGTVSKRYIQIGKGDSPESFTLRTSGISGTIKKVTVDCASGSAGHTIAISVGGNSYLAATATPTWSSNNGGTKSGTGTSSGEIVITFDKGSNTKAMYIHSIEVEYTNNIANNTSHYNAQSKVVEFAQYMNTEMNKTNVCTGNMSKLSTAWGNVADKYDDLFGEGTSLDETELAYAKNMLASATANWEEDHDSDEKYCLERAMATYEWCVSHYSGTCTAFMSAVRPLDSRVTNPIQIVINNSNVITIVAVMAMVSFTAFGAFYFLRKKEEKE